MNYCYRYFDSSYSATIKPWKYHLDNQSILSQFITRCTLNQGDFEEKALLCTEEMDKDRLSSGALTIVIVELGCKDSNVEWHNHTT